MALVEGKYTVASIFGSAENTAQKKMTGSELLDRDAYERFPKFRMSELTLGRVLGRGFFCAVNEVTRIQLQGGANNSNNNNKNRLLNDERVIHNLAQDRPFMATHCLRDRECRYAIKQLQDSVTTKKTTTAQNYIAGLVDLAIEARFLAVVRHPNIIKMRAVGAMGPFSTPTTGEPFFIVLDRLYDTLTVRMSKWKKKNSGAVMIMGGSNKRKAFWVERMEVAFDLGAALAYLHGKNIMYRDLKPDNIGFDVRGDVKLFDFGLAKELHPRNRRSDGTFLLTEDTVAPEVALGQPYSETADVYSFSILLWQILALEPPFTNYNMTLLKKHVYKGGQRPKRNPKWPNVIQDILNRGWQSSLQHRPSMQAMIEAIRSDLSEKTGTYYAGTAADQSSKSQRGKRTGQPQQQQQPQETARLVPTVVPAITHSASSERVEF